MPASAHSQRIIRFCLDYPASIGWGHGVRCSTIAHELLSRGCRVELLTTTPDTPPDMWGREFPATVHIPSWEYAPPHAGCDAWVIDHYALRSGHPFYDTLIQNRQSVIVIDDIPAPSSMENASGVINPNPYAKPSDYPAKPAVCGPSLALIRSGFHAPEAIPGIKDRLPPEFLVMIMGGSDPSHVAERSWEWIKNKNWAPPLPIVFVNPPFQIPESSIHISTRPLDAPGLSWLFDRASAVISAAGSTLCEIAFCNTPFVAVKVADNQTLTCKFAEDIWNMPVLYPDSFVPDELNRALSRITMGNSNARKHAFNPPVDAGGPGRAADFILRQTS